jgi:hypothetical protein
MPISGRTPIKITFYDADDEIVAEYERSTIPWGILKRCVQISSASEGSPDALSQEQLDEIALLLVDLFGGKFTVEDVNKGLDVADMTVLLNTIVARASAMVKANPTTVPSSRTKK